MTSPDTAAVRAWARDNGHDVADRGRLPAELHAAYLAAQGGAAKPAASSGSAARKAAAGKSGAGKAGAGKAGAGKPATKTAARKATPKATPKPAPKPAPASRTATKAAPEAVTPAAPQPAPAALAPQAGPDDDRIADLELQVDELAERLTAVEAALAKQAPAAPAKASRFRRRNG